jgi:hypothetical protein
MKHSRLFVITIGLAVALAPFATQAGNLDNAAAPAIGSSMPTTTEIYNRLNSGADISPSGSFRESASIPNAGTGRTLTEIQGKLPVVDNTHGAAVTDVLSGKTFWGLRNDGTWGGHTGTKAGVTPALGNNVTGANGSLNVVLPDGLYVNGKTVTINDINLAAGNMRNGAKIFGVTGNFLPQALAKRVNKTGQTQCWNELGTLLASCSGTGMDGEYKYGIDPVLTPYWYPGNSTVYTTPSFSGTRFIDNGNDTVTDNLTALIWLKDTAAYTGPLTWTNALALANNFSSITCHLSDVSTGKWRIPNINELKSLGPDWPPVGPFSNVKTSYWSSTTITPPTSPNFYEGAYRLSNGIFDVTRKDSTNYAWLVCGGQ